MLSQIPHTAWSRIVLLLMFVSFLLSQFWPIRAFRSVRKWMPVFITYAPGRLIGHTSLFLIMLACIMSIQFNSRRFLARKLNRINLWFWPIRPSHLFVYPFSISARRRTLIRCVCVAETGSLTSVGHTFPRSFQVRLVYWSRVPPFRAAMPRFGLLKTTKQKGFLIFWHLFDISVHQVNIFAQSYKTV